MESKTWHKRGVAGIIGFSLFGTQCLFAYQPEKNYWAERRCAASPSGANSRRGNGTLWASLPTLYSPVFPGSPKELSKLEPTLPEKIRRSLSPEFLSSRGDLLRTLPYAYGSIRKITPGASAVGPVIIHVQDIHQNLEAQKNIASTVAGLAGRVDLIALEGSTRRIDLARFRTFPDRAAIQLVADDALARNDITGPIHAALSTSGPFPPVVGVDDPIHYPANIDAYRRSAPRVGSLKNELALQIKNLNEEKDRVFSPALQAFHAKIEGYRDGRITLTAYLNMLLEENAGRPLPSDLANFSQALAIENRLDFTRVESERTRLIESLVKHLSQKEVSGLTDQGEAYRMGRIQYGEFYAYLKALCCKNGVDLTQFPAMNDYIRYVLLAGQVDAEQMFRQSTDLERTLYARLAQTKKERDLVNVSRHLFLTGKLLDFSLTPDEWTEYRVGPGPNKSAFTPHGKRGAGGAFQSLGKSGPKLIAPDFINHLSSFEDFYQEAHARDSFMADRALSALNEIVPHQNQASAVVLLVTGGYHASGLTERLTRSGATVISFVPKIEKIDTAQGAMALGVFAQEKTPLQKLFEGEKLFLGHNPGAEEKIDLAVPARVALVTGVAENLMELVGISIRPQILKVEGALSHCIVWFKDGKCFSETMNRAAPLGQLFSESIRSDGATAGPGNPLLDYLAQILVFFGRDYSYGRKWVSGGLVALWLFFSGSAAGQTEGEVEKVEGNTSTSVQLDPEDQKKSLRENVLKFLPLLGSNQDRDAVLNLAAALLDAMERDKSDGLPGEMAKRVLEARPLDPWLKSFAELVLLRETVLAEVTGHDSVDNTQRRLAELKRLQKLQGEVFVGHTAYLENSGPNILVSVLDVFQGLSGDLTYKDRVGEVIQLYELASSLSIQEKELFYLNLAVNRIGGDDFLSVDDCHAILDDPLAPPWLKHIAMGKLKKNDSPDESPKEPELPEGIVAQYLRNKSLNQGLRPNVVDWARETIYGVPREEWHTRLFFLDPIEAYVLLAFSDEVSGPFRADPVHGLRQTLVVHILAGLQRELRVFEEEKTYSPLLSAVLFDEPDWFATFYSACKETGQIESLNKLIPLELRAHFNLRVKKIVPRNPSGKPAGLLPWVGRPVYYFLGWVGVPIRWAAGIAGFVEQGVLLGGIYGLAWFIDFYWGIGILTGLFFLMVPVVLLFAGSHGEKIFKYVENSAHAGWRLDEFEMTPHDRRQLTKAALVFFGTFLVVAAIPHAALALFGAPILGPPDAWLWVAGFASSFVHALYDFTPQEDQPVALKGADIHDGKTVDKMIDFFKNYAVPLDGETRLQRSLIVVGIFFFVVFVLHTLLSDPMASLAPLFIIGGTLKNGASQTYLKAIGTDDPLDSLHDGEKAFHLGVISRLGVYIPPGFALLPSYFPNGFRRSKSLSPIWGDIVQSLRRLEDQTGQRLGDRNNPIFLSVRSNAVEEESMPGLMKTIVNVGLNQITFEGLVERDGELFAQDTKRRFIRSYATGVFGIEDEKFDFASTDLLLEYGVPVEAQLPLEGMARLVEIYRSIVREYGREIPEDVFEQLKESLEAVIKSFDSEGARIFREVRGLPEAGMGAIVQKMVFGNLNDRSGAGVVFTRNRRTGENTLDGQYGIKIQGDDVVQGQRAAGLIGMTDLKEKMPDIYLALLNLKGILENQFGWPQDVEFIIQNGELFVLQTRNEVLSPEGLLHAGADMVNEGIIPTDVFMAKKAATMAQAKMTYHFPARFLKNPVMKGAYGTPGAQRGRLKFIENFDPTKKYDDPVVIVANNPNASTLLKVLFSPHVAGLMVIEQGDNVSHAVIRCQSSGMPSLCGIQGVKRDGDALYYSEKEKIREGDWIIVDGDRRMVFLNEDSTVLEPSRLIMDLSLRFNDVDKIEEQIRRRWGDSDYEELVEQYVDAAVDLERLVEIKTMSSQVELDTANVRRHSLHLLIKAKGAELGLTNNQVNRDVLAMRQLLMKSALLEDSLRKGEATIVLLEDSSLVDRSGRKHRDIFREKADFSAQIEQNRMRAELIRTKKYPTMPSREILLSKETKHHDGGGVRYYQHVIYVNVPLESVEERNKKESLFANAQNLRFQKIVSDLESGSPNIVYDEAQGQYRNLYVRGNITIQWWPRTESRPETSLSLTIEYPSRQNLTITEDAQSTKINFGNQTLSALPYPCLRSLFISEDTVYVVVNHDLLKVLDNNGIPRIVVDPRRRENSRIHFVSSPVATAMKERLQKKAVQDYLEKDNLALQDFKQKLWDPLVSTLMSQQIDALIRLTLFFEFRRCFQTIPPLLLLNQKFFKKLLPGINPGKWADKEFMEGIVSELIESVKINIKEANDLLSQFHSESDSSVELTDIVYTSLSDVFRAFERRGAKLPVKLVEMLEFLSAARYVSPWNDNGLFRVALGILLEENTPTPPFRSPDDQDQDQDTVGPISGPGNQANAGGTNGRGIRNMANSERRSSAASGPDKNEGATADGMSVAGALRPGDTLPFVGSLKLSQADARSLFSRIEQGLDDPLYRVNFSKTMMSSEVDFSTEYPGRLTAGLLTAFSMAGGGFDPLAIHLLVVGPADVGAARESAAILKELNKNSTKPVRVIFAGADERVASELKALGDSDPNIYVVESPVAALEDASYRLVVPILAQGVKQGVDKFTLGSQVNLVVQVSRGITVNPDDLKVLGSPQDAISNALGAALNGWLTGIKAGPVEFNTILRIVALMKAYA